MRYHTYESMHSILLHILLKKGLRSDTFWTHPIIFNSFLKVIPLYFDTRTLMKSQYWTREELRQLQDERLRMLFSDAQHIPFWEKTFKATGVDASMSPQEILSKLPIISKKDLGGQNMDQIADVALLKKSDPDHTSGSTGRPFHFYFDWRASLRSYAVTERIFRTATGGTRFPIVYMRSRPRNGFTFWKHVWFFLRGHRGVAYRMDEFEKLKRLKRGFVLYGYTSSVLEVARQIEKRQITLPIRAVMATGESIGTADRMYLERTMGVEFFGVYASREVGYLGYECEQHVLHLSEEWACIEIVDEEGKVLEPGREGRIIVTTFDNRVMPFIRYELGDRGIISDVPCACGRTLRTISLRGRTAEMIELEDGRTLALLDVSATFDWYWSTVRQFQIVQTSTISFVFKVVPGPNFAAGKPTLEAELIGLIHPRVQISWEIVETIPEAKSGKAVYFIRDF